MTVMQEDEERPKLTLTDVALCFVYASGFLETLHTQEAVTICSLFYNFTGLVLNSLKKKPSNIVFFELFHPQC